jgi:hypothetical protein
MTGNELLEALGNCAHIGSAYMTGAQCEACSFKDRRRDATCRSFLAEAAEREIRNLRDEIAPRVLDLSDIEKHDGAVWLDYADTERYGGDWALFFCEDILDNGIKLRTAKVGVIWLPADDYGVEWRAWTRRPSDEDRARWRWGKKI